MTRFKVPKKYQDIFSELERRRFAVMKIENGDMGYLRSLESRINKTLDGDSFNVFYDKKRKRVAIIRTKRMKKIRRTPTGVSLNI